MKTLIYLFVIVLAALNNTYADNPKLHPVEAMCITYEMSGQMQNGSQVTCHRDFGYEKYEISNITIGIAGFTQTQNTHNITVGDTIYAIDLSNNTGTKTTNPMYADTVSAMEGKDPDEMTQAFISGMGFQATGNSKNIAGYDCQLYTGQLGSVCLTDQGIMLEQALAGNTTTATQVDLGNSGDDSNYTLYENVTISQGPDLSNFNLQDLMNQ